MLRESSFQMPLFILQKSLTPLLSSLLLDVDSASPGNIGCPRAKHPVLHSQPLAPGSFCRLDLLLCNFLKRLEERDVLAIGHIIVGLDLQPVLALGGEEVVLALGFVYWTDALGPVIAEEAVQDGGEIETGNYEAADVWDQSDVHRDECALRGGRAEGSWSRGRGRAWRTHRWAVGVDGMDRMLEGKLDVDEGGYDLNGRGVLGFI